MHVTPDDPFGESQVPQGRKPAESPEARWVPPVAVAPPASRGRPMTITPADLARFASLPEDQQKAAMLDGIRTIQRRCDNVSLKTTTCVSKVSGDPRKTNGAVTLLALGEFGTHVYELRRIGSSYRIEESVSYPGPREPQWHIERHDAESGVNQFFETQRVAGGKDQNLATISKERSGVGTLCAYASYLGGLDFLGFPENDIFKFLLEHQTDLRVRGIDQQSRLVEVSLTYTDERADKTVSWTAWLDLGKDWMLRRLGREEKYRRSARAGEETYQSFEVSESEQFDGVWLPTKVREITWSSRYSFGNLRETTAENIKIGSVKKDDLEIVFPAGTVVSDEITGDRWTVGLGEKAKSEPKEKPGVEKPLLLSSAGSVRDELQAFNGAWKVEKVENKGKVNPAVYWLHEKADRFVFDAGEFEVNDFMADKSDRGRYHIDPSAKPKSIDISQGHERYSLKYVGIYEIDADRLTIRLTRFLPDHQPNDLRPKSFALEPDSEDAVFTLRRLRPTADEKALSGKWKVIGAYEDGKRLESPIKMEVKENWKSEKTTKEFSLPTEMFFKTDSNDCLLEFKIRSSFANELSHYQVDSNREPKQIIFFTRCKKLTLASAEDFLPSVRMSPVTPDEYHGIFKIDGDRLTIALRKDGPAPDKFESTPGSGVTLLELKRAEHETGNGCRSHSR